MRADTRRPTRLATYRHDLLSMNRVETLGADVVSCELTLAVSGAVLVLVTVLLDVMVVDEVEVAVSEHCEAPVQRPYTSVGAKSAAPAKEQLTKGFEESSKPS